MPKYGIHYIILEGARNELLSAPPDSLAFRRGQLLAQNPGFANLGAIGPDLFFYAPDYTLMELMVPYNDAYRKVKNLYAAIMEPVEEVWEAVAPYVDEVLENVPIVDDLVKLCKQVRALDELISATEKELYRTALVGLLGLDPSLHDASHRFRGLYQKLFESGTQHGAEEPDWYWFDMLHYRKTGDFARNLLAGAAGDDELQAYALAYTSHIAGDTVGHPYVNQICAAPYRIAVQRHVTAENFMDQWKWYSLYGDNIRSTLVERYELMPSMPDKLADLLSATLKKTYGGVAHPLRMGAGGLTPSQMATFDWGFLSPQDVKDTYSLLLTFMEMLGDNPDLRPEEPYPGADEDLAQLSESLDIFDPPPPLAPPQLPSCDWESVFDDPAGDCFEAFVADMQAWVQMVQDYADWARDTGRKALNLTIDVLENPPAGTPAGYPMLLLYAWQLRLYGAFRALNGLLARAGLTYPEPEEASFEVPLSRSLIMPTPDFYDLASFPRMRPSGFNHLVPPRCVAKRECCELPRTNAAFYSVSSQPTPDRFIHEAAFNQAAVLMYAAASTPQQTKALHDQGVQIGNATQFTEWMIANADNPASTHLQDAVFCNWNLDGDRGYGYKTWDGLPPLCDPGVIEVSLKFTGDGNDHAGDWGNGNYPGPPFDDLWPGVLPDATPNVLNDKGVTYVGDKQVDDCIFNALNLAQDAIPEVFSTLSSSASAQDWAALTPHRLRLTSTSYLRNVRYVNGIRTDHYGCVVDMVNLRDTLQHAIAHQGLSTNPAVVAMHNRTSGAMGDVWESVPDKIHAYRMWLRLQNPANVPIPKLLNPSTAAVVALLHHAMVENRRMMLVGYSQGTLITGNAAMTFAAMGQQQADFLHERVKLLHLAVVHYPCVIAHIKSLFGSDRYLAYRRTGDPLAAALSSPPNVPTDDFPDPFIPEDLEHFANPEVTPEYIVASFDLIDNATKGLLKELKAVAGSVPAGTTGDPHALPNYLADVLTQVENDGEVEGVKTRDFLFG